MRRLVVMFVALVLIGAPSRGAAEAILALGPAQYQSLQKAPLDQLIEEADRSHPIAMMVLARRLYESGQRDDAVFWFYAGQLRWRAQLVASPSQADLEAFTTLFQAMEEINSFSACNTTKLQATVDRVLAWDQSHPDPLATPASAKDKLREGLKQQATELSLDVEDVRKARESSAACLPLTENRRADPYVGYGGAMFGTPGGLLTDFDRKRFSEFKRGVTKKEQVIAALGPPDWWATDDQGMLTLGYSYAQSAPSSFALRMSQVLQVNFAFDHEGNLRKLTLPR
jgi:hypothetical protein